MINLLLTTVPQYAHCWVEAEGFLSSDKTRNPLFAIKSHLWGVSFTQWLWWPLVPISCLSLCSLSSPCALPLLGPMWGPDPLHAALQTDDDQCPSFSTMEKVTDAEASFHFSLLCVYVCFSNEMGESKKTSSATLVNGIKHLCTRWAITGLGSRTIY